MEIAYHVKMCPSQLQGEALREDVYTSDTKVLVAKKGSALSEATLHRLAKFNAQAPLQVRRHIKRVFTSDGEFANAITKTAHAIVEGALLGQAVTPAQRDALFDMLYYCNPYNFDRIVNHLGAIEAFDNLTFEHSMRVAWLMIRTGNILGMDAPDLKDLMQIGLLHDLGKTMLPASILKSKKRLTDTEMAVIKKHPQYSYELVRRVASGSVAEAVLNHHERIDGSGYPKGIGKDLALYSQLIGIVDVYEAIVAQRSYKASMSPFKALNILKEDVFGGKYDYTLYSKFEQGIIGTLIGDVIPQEQNRRMIGYDSVNCMPYFDDEGFEGHFSKND